MFGQRLLRQEEMQGDTIARLTDHPRNRHSVASGNKAPEEASLKQARFVEVRGGSSLWNEASFSAQTGRFKGGTGIVLSARMSKIVTHHGILYP